MTPANLQITATSRLGATQLAFDLTVGDGVTAILGSSGAGKTSLLNLVAGLIKPDTGRICFGQDIWDDTQTRLHVRPAARQIGYVFQDNRLFPHLTVAQNLAYGQRWNRAGTPVTDLGEIADLLDLQALLNRYPHRLSGGEKKRVAIARALLAAPRLLLLDEPLTGLDPKRRAEFMPYLERLVGRLRLPVLYVTHNIDEAVRLASTLIVIDTGRVVADGSPVDVLSRPNVQQLLFADTSDIEQSEWASFFEVAVTRHDAEAHTLEVQLGSANLYLLARTRPSDKKMIVRIQARDVALSTAPPSGLSIQNALAGRIRAIEPLGEAQIAVSLSLDGMEDGPGLRAHITARAATALNLKPDQRVWALVKSVALTQTGS